jgi:MoaA/NifB/PqqE/SkfB family radical SAM enzyme
MQWWHRVKATWAFGRLLTRFPVPYLKFLMTLPRSRRKWHNGQLFLNTFFPPFPSKSFDRFVNQMLSGQRRPISTYIAVTPHCPCRCDHCSYGAHEKRKMSDQQLFAAVRQVRDLGASIIGLTGGEPLLRRDLADLIRSISADTTPLIFTTGHGLTPQRARELADAGATTIVLGLESANPVEHDRIRKLAGSFDQVRQAAQACLAAGLYTTVSTIGFSQRIESGALERIYELAIEWGIHEIRIPNPIATGGIAGRPGLMLQPQEVRKLYDFHIAGNQRRDNGPIVTCFARIESKELFGCGAGYHHLFVDAAGEVCPCDVTPLSFGNLNERPLAEIWDEMGAYFSQPRCACLMNEVAPSLPREGTLPVIAQLSRTLVSPPSAGDPVPAAYRILFAKKAGEPVPENPQAPRSPLRRVA